MRIGKSEAVRTVMKKVEEKDRKISEWIQLKECYKDF